jgi:hypothetical protein
MSNEIIHIVACDDYEGFQHLIILFSGKKSFKHLKDYLMMKLTLW